MAITGAGFDGTLTEADWARIAGPQGIPDQSIYGATATDYALTVSTAGLSATVAPGTYNRHGILSKSTATETVSFTNPASGSRWDTVALLVDWTTNTVTLVVVQGGTTPTVPWSSMQASVGTKIHVPLHLVQLTAGSAAPTDSADVRIGRTLLPATYARKTSTGISLAAGKYWAIAFATSVRSELPVTDTGNISWQPGAGIYDLLAVMPLDSGSGTATLRINSTVGATGSSSSPGGTELMYTAAKAGGTLTLSARGVRLGPGDVVQVIVSPDTGGLGMVGAQPHLSITRVAD